LFNVHNRLCNPGDDAAWLHPALQALFGNAQEELRALQKLIRLRFAGGKISGKIFSAPVSLGQLSALGVNARTYQRGHPLFDRHGGNLFNHAPMKSPQFLLGSRWGCKSIFHF
jgi:hypothetical protein